MSSLYWFNNFQAADITAVLADNKTHPYAFMFSTANTSIGVRLMLSENPFYAVSDGTRNIAIHLPMDTKYLVYDCPDINAGWVYIKNDTITTTQILRSRLEKTWASHDICYDTGEVAVAASEPIPDDEYVAPYFTANIPDTIVRGQAVTIPYTMGGNGITDKSASVLVMAEDYSAFYFMGEYADSPITMTPEIPETVGSVYIVVSSVSYSEFSDMKLVDVIDGGSGEPEPEPPEPTVTAKQLRAAFWSGFSSGVAT